MEHAITVATATALDKRSAPFDSDAVTRKELEVFLERFELPGPPREWLRHVYVALRAAGAVRYRRLTIVAGRYVHLNLWVLDHVEQYMGSPPGDMYRRFEARL